MPLHKYFNPNVANESVQTSRYSAGAKEITLIMGCQSKFRTLPCQLAKNRVKTHSLGAVSLFIVATKRRNPAAKL